MSLSDCPHILKRLFGDDIWILFQDYTTEYNFTCSDLGSINKDIQVVHIFFVLLLVCLDELNIGSQSSNLKKISEDSIIKCNDYSLSYSAVFASLLLSNYYGIKFAKGSKELYLI